MPITPNRDFNARDATEMPEERGGGERGERGSLAP
jgi:hypothetical protein